MNKMDKVASIAWPDDRFETIAVTRDAGVVTLTLDRPDAKNALNPQMCLDLFRASLLCDEDDSVRAVVLTGDGDQMFCPGGDIRSFAAAGPGAGALVKEMTTYLHAAVSRFARMSAPLIAAVNGSAAGAGMSLVAMSDLVIAGDNAKFALAYTKAGFTPDGSSTYFLSRVIGMRRVYELALTNRMIDAETALDWGLINRIVPAADLQAEAMALAQSLAAGPTESYGATKALLLEATTVGLETQMEYETRAIAEAMTGPDGQEGIVAFLEKRPPVFKGEG